MTAASIAVDVGSARGGVTLWVRVICFGKLADAMHSARTVQHERQQNSARPSSSLAFPCSMTSYLSEPAHLEADRTAR